MSHTIEFTGSGKTLRWTGLESSLLELAEANGLNLDFGCREGRCTACQQRVEGKVSYPQGHTGEPEPGYALLCCSVPESDLKVEA